MVTEEEKLEVIRDGLENEIITKLKKVTLTCDDINALSSAYSKLAATFLQFPVVADYGCGRLEEDDSEIRS